MTNQSTRKTAVNQKVSAVIPTYNGKDLLVKHLPRVLSCLRAGDELIIVDDHSQDETLDFLIDQFEAKIFEDQQPRVDDLPSHYRPQVGSSRYLVGLGSWSTPHQGKIRVVIVVNPANKRFAASVNTGVALASHDLIFLLNNDVSPQANVLDHLIPHFSKSPNLFAAGCLEYEGEWSNFDSPQAGKNKLWFERGLYQHSRASNYESGETAWVSGGSGLFSREKWLEIGGFDLDFYPAYWEDVDLSFRARQRGWKVLFESRAVVFHQHESSNDSVFGQNRLTDLSWRQARLFTWKHSNWWQRLQFLFWQPYWWWQRRRHEG